MFVPATCPSEIVDSARKSFGATISERKHFTVINSPRKASALTCISMPVPFSGGGPVSAAAAASRPFFALNLPAKNIHKEQTS